jgi:hypothetical protein
MSEIIVSTAVLAKDVNSGNYDRSNSGIHKRCRLLQYPRTGRRVKPSMPVEWRAIFLPVSISILRQYPIQFIIAIFNP